MLALCEAIGTFGLLPKKSVHGLTSVVRSDFVEQAEPEKSRSGPTDPSHNVTSLLGKSAHNSNALTRKPAGGGAGAAGRRGSATPVEKPERSVDEAVDSSVAVGVTEKLRTLKVGFTEEAGEERGGGEGEEEVDKKAVVSDDGDEERRDDVVEEFQAAANGRPSMYQFYSGTDFDNGGF